MSTYVLGIAVTAVIILQFSGLIYLAFIVDEERSRNIRLERKLQDLINYMNRREQEYVENRKSTSHNESVSVVGQNGSEVEEHC